MPDISYVTQDGVYQDTELGYEAVAQTGVFQERPVEVPPVEEERPRIMWMT